MKNLKALTLLILLITVVTIAPSYATTSNAVKKAKQAVSESPYDWKILAESAEICFSQGENIEEAMKWVDKSIEINKDPKNLEIKADFLVAQGKKAEALEYYVEAINTGKSQNFWFDTSALQKKLWELR